MVFGGRHTHLRLEELPHGRLVGEVHQARYLLDVELGVLQHQPYFERCVHVDPF